MESTKTIKMTNKLEKEELKSIQELNSQFQQLKLALGEVALREADIVEEVKNVKSLFMVEEKKLIEKYGANAIINLQTGEITENTEN
jgi:hypothetical protein